MCGSPSSDQFDGPPLAEVEQLIVYSTMYIFIIWVHIRSDSKLIRWQTGHIDPRGVYRTLTAVRAELVGLFCWLF